MGLFASAFGPSASIGSHDSWLVRAIGGKSKAGPSVSEFGALHLSTVYACVNRISNPVSQVSLNIMQKAANGGAAMVTQHPMSASSKDAPLGLRPNPFMSSRNLRKTTQGHALLWGNGYQEIQRNNGGEAIGLWPLLPWNTRPHRVDGDLIYRTNIDGQGFDINHGDVLHVMDLSQDGYVGLSQVAMARQAIGLALALEEFGSKFFANDAKSGGFLLHPGKLSTAAQENLGAGKKAVGKPAVDEANPGARLEKQGGLDNAHRVKVLEEGMKFVQTTIPPEDAQFLATRGMQIAEIARIYDVPMILLQSQEGTTAWGTGIEQLMIGFVRQTIAPWIGAWEQEMNWKLFTAKERQEGLYVKFNLNALLRGDSAARAALYTALFGMAAINPNQICELEDMEPIGDQGNTRFVPVNMQTLDRAINPPAPPPIGHSGGPALDDAAAAAEDESAGDTE